MGALRLQDEHAGALVIDNANPFPKDFQAAAHCDQTPNPRLRDGRQCAKLNPSRTFLMVYCGRWLRIGGWGGMHREKGYRDEGRHRI